MRQQVKIIFSLSFSQQNTIIMSSLKDFYNNPEVEDEEDSEDDEDFVPDGKSG